MRTLIIIFTLYLAITIILAIGITHFSNLPRRILSCHQVERWENLIYEVSDETGVNSKLLAAIMCIESQGLDGVDGLDGEVGLMQVMPMHHAYRRGDIIAPKDNISRAADFLRALYLHRVGENINLGLGYWKHTLLDTYNYDWDNPLIVKDVIRWYNEGPPKASSYTSRVWDLFTSN